MEKAYVLLSFARGQEPQGVAFCSKIPGVNEIVQTWGVWDAVAKVEAENVTSIRTQIIERMREFGGLMGTMCLPIIPS